MSLDSRSKLISWLLIISSVIAVAYAALYHLTPTSIFFANDQSTDFIVARSASQGTWPLLGPPSHVGGRHLGPIYYWYVIAVVFVAGFDPYVASIIFVVSKLACLLGFYIFLSKFFSGTARILAVGGLSIAVLSSNYLEIIRTQWHSNYLFIISGFVTISALSVVSYPQKIFPVFLVCLMLLSLSHLSAFPVVVALSATILFYLYKYSLIRKVFMQRSTALAMLVSTALFIPTAIYEMCYPSNFGKLLQTHSHSHGGKEAGIGEAVRVALNFVLDNTAAQSLHTLTYRPIEAAFAILFFLLTIHAVLNRANPYRWHFAVLLMPIVTTSAILSFFKAPLFPHYFNSSITVPAFLLVFALAYAEILRQQMKAHRVISIICISFICCSLLLIPIKVRRMLQIKTAEDHKSIFVLSHVEAISDIIRADADEQNPSVFARLSSKLVRNSYYYFLNIASREMEYKGVFREVNGVTPATGKQNSKKGYIVFCPKPFSHVKKDMFRKFFKAWNIKESIMYDSCEIVRMERKL